MKERANSFRNDSGSQIRPGDARKRSGTLLSGWLLEITRFRPRRAALILGALALAITGFAALLTVTAAASAGPSSPVVSWAEPDHPGPNIADFDAEGYDADYDLRYRIGDSRDEFAYAEYAGDQTGPTVTGLDGNTAYEAELASRPDRRDRPCRRPDRGNHALVGHADGGGK